jgi:NAD(P)-dependent dehydrogenase (short-subunit alcohol dehydrogenase family)
MFDLTGKVALVTGSGRGVGAGIAEALGRQGAKVVINDFFPERADEMTAKLTADGINALSVPFDVTDMQAVKQAVARIEATMGSIDILINNVGTLAEGMVPTAFLDTPEADWPKHINNNLYGTMNCCRCVSEGMLEKGWGRIIAISSDAARGGNVGSSVYGAAKAGMEGFMRSLAKEFGPGGITANSIVLGLINTVPPEFSKGAGRYFATGRIGTPQDIGAAAVYLSSEEAGWVTGHSLVVNGGYLR